MEEDPAARLNALSRSIEEARSRISVSAVEISKYGYTRSTNTSRLAEKILRLEIIYVIFVLFWVAALGSSIVYTTTVRSGFADLIRNTAEYRCVAATNGGKPILRWSAFRHLKANDPRLGSYTIGTLSEKRGMNCIQKGDAISFAMLPLGRGTALSLIRIHGRGLEVEQRDWGQWMDIVSADGAERWRNDGDGYRKVSP